MWHLLLNHFVLYNIDSGLQPLYNIGCGPQLQLSLLQKDRDPANGVFIQPSSPQRREAVALLCHRGGFGPSRRPGQPSLRLQRFASSPAPCCSFVVMFKSWTGEL